MPEIQAHITKVEKEEDTGWGRISTDHPQIKKLTTRIAEKISEAAALKREGGLVSIQYTENERTVQTDNGPRTFHNYYYERAKAANGTGTVADDGIDVIPSRQQQLQTDGAVSRKTDADDAWRMCLNKGGELAVGTLTLMPADQRDFETQKTIAKAWAEFFFFTARPSSPTAYVTTQPTVSRGAYSEPDSIEYPPPDDDIPY